MEVDDAISRRRSIRKYLDQPLDWELIGKVVDAGRLAPSSGNLQPWKFVVVTEPERRKKLAEACMKQMWMQTAPVHIVICSETTKLSRFYGIRGERLYSIQNCAAAAENMIIKATDLGLSTCWVSAFDEEMVKRAIKMPDFVRPQIVITLGYGDETVPEPPKYTPTDVIFLQTYGNRVRDALGILGFTSHKVEGAVQKGRDFLEKSSKKSDKVLDKLSKRLKGEKGKKK